MFVFGRCYSQVTVVIATAVNSSCWQMLLPRWCYVRQYSLVDYSLKCLGVFILHMIMCTVIHNCSS